MMRKGDLGVPAMIGIVFGIVLIVIAIVIGFRLYNNASQTECWKGVNEQINSLCLKEGFTCAGPEPGIPLYKTITLGKCVDYVMFMSSSEIRQRMIEAQIKGQDVECPLDKNSYIVMVPVEVGFWGEGIADTLKHPIEAWKRTMAKSICKWYDVRFQGFQGQLPTLKGPGEDKNSISYCIRISAVGTTYDSKPDYYISAKEGTCAEVSSEFQGGSSGGAGASG